MEEEIIKFKTAKLAKEKGFDWKVLNHYRDGESYSKELINGGSWYNMNCSKEQKLWNCNLYSAPTQSLLSTWLKKTYGLYAYIDWVDDEVVIVDFKNSEGEELFRVNCYDFVPDYESEEELLEELLQKALKLIK